MPNIENNTMSTFTIGGKTYEIEDTSARSNIQTINTVLDTKADTSDMSNYYTKSETYTKTEVDDLIESSENSDWEETDTTDNAYILNKPAIKAGEDENSVLIGQIEQEENAQIFTLYLTGAGKATTFSYTTEDDLSGITVASFKMYGILFTGSTVPYRYITDIDTTQKTISVNSQISSSAITNQKMLLYYFYKLSNDDSVAEGLRTKAVGTHSHAEGANSIAIAASSHSEGNNTKAVGTVSHAEGNSSIASGIGSHAENNHTVASGSYSHAENYYTVASGEGSHAEGYGTISQSNYSHVEGKFNISGDYLHVAGNGTDGDNRSNAYTLDWQGNGWYAGKLTVGTDPTANMDVATKQYVDSAMSNYALKSEIPTVTNDFTDGYKDKVDSLWEDYQDALTALG